MTLPLLNSPLFAELDDLREQYIQLGRAIDRMKVVTPTYLHISAEAHNGRPSFSALGGITSVLLRQKILRETHALILDTMEAEAHRIHNRIREIVSDPIELLERPGNA